MTTNDGMTHHFGPGETFTAEQKAWLRSAHRTVIRLLKKYPTFHAPDFWVANTAGDYPKDRFGIDNRILGRVTKQILKAGLMTDSNPGWALRVGTSGTFKPVFFSNLHEKKVDA